MYCIKLEIKKETSKIIKDNDINDTQSADYDSGEKPNVKTGVFIFVYTVKENCDDMSLKINHLVLNICNTIKQFDKIFLHSILSSFLMNIFSSFVVIIFTVSIENPQNIHSYIAVVIQLLILTISLGKIYYFGSSLQELT